MKFTPFVDKSASLALLPSGSIIAQFERRRTLEGRFNFHAADYVLGSASGSFTAQIDPFRQGVSVINEKMRATRVLPTIDSGENDFTVIKLNYGSDKLYDDYTPFVDKFNLQTINATEGLLALIEGKITAASFSSPDSDHPVIQADKNYIVTDIKDGAIEVFPIRFKAFDNKIFSRSLDPIGHDAKKGIKAHIMAGNETLDQGSDRVANLIEWKPVKNPYSPFVDRGGYFVSSSLSIDIVMPGNSYELLSGSILVPNSKHARGQVISKPTAGGPTPFNEDNYKNRMFLQTSFGHMDKDFERVMLQMSSSKADSERHIPFGFKSAQTGFIFTNGGLNVDSLAYGGLKRDA